MTHRRIRRMLQANMKFEGLDAQTILNEAIRGKLNNVNEVYLRKDGTSTPISDDLISTNSMLNWSARDAVAASYINTLWYSSTENGRVILNHVSTSTSTVLYDFMVVG